ncbi:MAG: ABC transporter substrate-binding protein [Candidatus Dormiibacterota bacterium]
MTADRFQPRQRAIPSRLRVLALAALPAMVVAACGSGSGSSATTKVPVTFAAFNPFTGADAVFGALMISGCDAAVQVINQAGGILGGKVSCVSVDTHGDPADAVVAANRAIATTSHLDGVVGPSSDEALATVPVFNQSHIPMFGDTGQVQFDHSTYPYFWRLSQADDLQAKAMAFLAYQKGYRYATTVFGGDPGGQAVDTPVKATFTALGGTIVKDVQLTFDQTSYRTEIEQILAANPKPQVIFTETDPQTSATFFAEWKELTGGLIPIIGDETTLDSTYRQAISNAVGAAVLAPNFSGIQNFVDPTSTPFKLFANSLKQVPGLSASNIASYSSDPFPANVFDSVNIMALAMVAANSTTNYNNFINAVVNPGAGKVVVSSYADGVTALKAGHQIQYVGTVGPITFNKYHDSAGTFAIATYDVAGNRLVTGMITSSQIAALPT